MRALRLLPLLLLLAAPAFALGPNSTSASLTVQNANGNTGACTVLSCVLLPVHQGASGTIFTGSDARYGTASLQITGTWVGTITFQYSQDEGATWNNYGVYPLVGGSIFATSVTSTTANGNWVVPVQGITTFRAVMSTFTSGTAAVAMEVLLQPAAVAPIGGMATTSYQNSSVAGTVQQVKATQAQLQCLSLLNTTAAVAYLQIFYLPSASVTLGTTVPNYFVGMAASQGTSFCFPAPVGGSGSGLSLAGTTTAGGLTGAAIAVSVAYQ